MEYISGRNNVNPNEALHELRKC